MTRFCSRFLTANDSCCSIVRDLVGLRETSKSRRGREKERERYHWIRYFKYQELKVPLDLLFKVESIWKLQEINLEAAWVERR